jgi:hypothetical protein
MHRFQPPLNRSRIEAELHALAYFLDCRKLCTTQVRPFSDLLHFTVPFDSQDQLIPPHAFSNACFTLIQLLDEADWIVANQIKSDLIGL